jgi:hypothetical protein
MQYVRRGPTPWLRTSHPASVSIGDPQFPSWTSSQGKIGLSSTLRSYQKCYLGACKCTILQPSQVTETYFGLVAFKRMKVLPSSVTPAKSTIFLTRLRRKMLVCTWSNSGLKRTPGVAATCLIALIDSYYVCAF